MTRPENRTLENTLPRTIWCQFMVPSFLALSDKLNSNSQDRIMFAGHAPALQALDFLQVAV
ncbi:uncharacterized protein ACLA_098150 [Aspergillus clavatus NRRL 1]|uniref:Uncharacterized protein n=1 Tax=Aspergillus clavatus (strain ATCC 1007 / CBS 513.65 / DSM 816 / NCTC 3887 / NRRL 1 / QM 1276 / 107) TaxID=344612 RepID=A1CMT6_ASPCL|nr:uncharacterized protein ACLA_098150 [Aspergillus clavatus NRRL 1]EAW08873.1 hypothetical protein ACLA_098150 [Aspergillus clavatus NRRL 1]